MKDSKVTIKLNSRNILPKLEKEATKRMWDAVSYVQAEVLQTLSGDRSGRVYNIPGTNKTYVASAPGEPPAVRTGGLRFSIENHGARVIQEDKSIKGQVGTDLLYGLWLEMGTSKMLPRPWLEPTFRRCTERIKERLSREWL